MVFGRVLRYKETAVADDGRAMVKETCLMPTRTERGVDALHTYFPSPAPSRQNKDQYCTRATDYNRTDIWVPWTKQHIIQDVPEERRYIKFAYFIVWGHFALVLMGLCSAALLFRSCNLLKSTGYVMHQQFNIQQLYALPTLCLCVLYLSENKQRLVPLTA